MTSKCIEKLPHRTDKCNSSNGLQVFQKEAGTFDGYCFACGTHVIDPYGDKPKGYKPNVFIKSAEEIQAELDEIQTYQVRDLPDRKLKRGTLDTFSVKVGTSEGDGETIESHYYPYRKNGVLVGYKVRLVSPKSFWAIGTTKDTEFFGWQEAIGAGAKRLFITEGELDCLSLFQIFKDVAAGTPYAAFNPAVVSLTNGAGSAVKQITAMLPEIRKHFKEIVLVFDNDAAGQEAVQEVIKLVPDALVASLPAKDVNEALVHGRSKAVHAACQFNAAKPKNTRLVTASSVLDEARKEVEWGFSYPFKQLTEMTRGQKLGTTVYWGGAAKIGKSLVLDALVAHNIVEHGWKCFVAKPEELNARTVQGVVGKIVNRIFHDPKIPFDHAAFNKGAEILGDNLLLLNMYQELKWEILEADIRDAVSNGCKAVFIDPISVLTNGVNAADANTLLQSFAQKLTQMAMDLGFICHIYCHLKAPETGLAHERGGAVQSHQFSGSRAMMRACHAMIGIQGNKDPDLPEEQRNIREIVLLENRLSGETGKFKIFYDKMTGSFNEIV